MSCSIPVTPTECHFQTKKTKQAHNQTFKNKK